MRTRWARNLLWLVPLLLLLNGCHLLRRVSSYCTKPQPYMGATSVTPLKIPAGLDAPDTTNALRLPALNEPAPPRRTSKDPCLDYPPSFKVTKPATPQA
ncbi:MAG TPA: hypothetical protein VET66_15390 [Steroidobacteraceae bacterium]|nr:hypothetical protein [Steroidobacteraceae bacterium]